MDQFLKRELRPSVGAAKRGAGGLSVGAAAVGATSLFWREAGSEAADGTVSKPHGLLSPANDEKLENAPVARALLAWKDLTEHQLLEPAGDVSVVPVMEADQISAAVSGTPTPFPISAFPSIGVQFGPATIMVGNIKEVAQAPTGGGPSIADGSVSYWPEGHWADDRAGGGFLGTALGLGGGLGFTALLAAGGWYTWQYIYGKPSFDHSIVYLKFDEGLCGDPVYTAPGKGSGAEILHN